MREFNDREKNIIKIFSQIDSDNMDLLSYHLKNDYFHKENNQALIVHKRERTAALYLKKKVFDNINLRKKEYFFFMELLALINYLKTHRYITIFPMYNESDEGLIVIRQSFDPWVDNKDILHFNKEGLHLSTSGEIVDKDGIVFYEGFTLTKEMYSLILENMEGVVVVSKELSDLYKNDFKSKEDRKFNKSQNIAWFSIIVALIFGVVSLYFSLRKNENNVRLNYEQFQTFSKKYDEIIQINKEINFDIKNLKKEPSKK
jgi:hypothetical protein